MRILFFYIMVLCLLHVSYSQEDEHPKILETANWGSEFFDFPIKFAPSIPYKGYEEAVFPKGWSNEESNAFWSYAFAWKIEANIPISSKDLELQLETYFNGLMDIKNRKNDTTILPTKVSLKSIERNVKNAFIGAVYFYEGRYTKQMMTLYTKASLFHCKNENKLIILFKFSPKDFNATIWEDLNKITVMASSCD